MLTILLFHLLIFVTICIQKDQKQKPKPKPKPKNQQLRGTIEGQLYVLNKFDLNSSQLVLKDQNDQIIQNISINRTANQILTFEQTNLPYQTYILELVDNKHCFENYKYQIMIDKNYRSQPILFEQIGYKLHYNSSQDIELQLQNKQQIENIYLSYQNEYGCLLSYGKYKVMNDSCKRYDGGLKLVDTRANINQVPKIRQYKVQQKVIFNIDNKELQQYILEHLQVLVDNEPINQTMNYQDYKLTVKQGYLSLKVWINQDIRLRYVYRADRFRFNVKMITGQTVLYSKGCQKLGDKELEISRRIMIAFDEKPKFDYQIVILDDYNENIFSQTMNRQYFELSDSRIKLNKIFLFKEGYYIYRKVEHIDQYNVQLNVRIVKQTRLEVRVQSEVDKLPNITIYLKNGTTVQNATTNLNGFYAFKDLKQAEYQVRPELQGYDFEPSEHNVTVLEENHHFLVFKAKKTFKVYDSLADLKVRLDFSQFSELEIQEILGQEIKLDIYRDNVIHDMKYFMDGFELVIKNVKVNGEYWISMRFGNKLEQVVIVDRETEIVGIQNPNDQIMVVYVFMTLFVVLCLQKLTRCIIR